MMAGSSKRRWEAGYRNGLRDGGKSLSKPRITTAAVLAAHDVFDQPVPDNYFKVSSDEQRQIRLSIVRLALIAAYTADQRRNSE